MKAPDDKSLIILALLLIAIHVIWVPPSENTISVLNAIVSGMLGMAIGRATQ